MIPKKYKFLNETKQQQKSIQKKKVYFFVCFSCKMNINKITDRRIYSLRNLLTVRLKCCRVLSNV